jgi:tetratricopeptide (TPR) repeat protein
VVASSNYFRTSAPAGYPVGASAVAASTDPLDAVRHLVEQADSLRLRAPELVLVLGERAAALAETAGSDELWIRAESLVVAAKVTLGDRPASVGRGVAALRAAEDAGYGAIAAGLRVNLAVCARSVGDPLTALAALRPVLANPDLPGAQRAEALCHLVGCMAQFGRKAELDKLLVEADKLVSADEGMDADARLLQRALLRVGFSAHRRRHGDLTAAADAARTGLGFLDRLEKPEDDGGLVRIRLILQLACTLLDRGDAEMAMEISQPLLAAPTRAAGIGPAGWLRLAIATRVHLPAGSGEAASTLLRDAVYSTDHHGLHALTSRLWLELAQLEERLGRPSDAIECLHRSRAAEHVHARSRRQALALLSSQFGDAQQAPVDLDDVLAVDTNRSASAPAPTPALVRPTGGHRAPEIPAVPELQLAPAPAEEPAPRVTLVPEPRVVKAVPAEPAPKSVPEAQLPSSVRWEKSRARERSTAIPKPPPTTRHDSDHGSEPAKSVLDRLGISSGGGGGRRRASDDSTELAPAASAKTEAAPAEPVKPEVVKPEPAKAEAPAPEPVVEQPPAAPPRLTDDEYRDQVADPWLPRLRMPPSLEPLDDSGLSWTPSESSSSGRDSANGSSSNGHANGNSNGSSNGSAANGSTSNKSSSNGNHNGNSNGNADLGSPFPDSYARAIAEDEPPPDAGLAELLARALAEHQAGTASAAALVKRLGSQSDEPASGRPVNGHPRSGASGPDNGRHRTGE